MTSPVDTSVKFFTSQMVGAPVWNGVSGSTIGLLDACLKDGFDLKTLSSLTVASGVATAVWTGSHSSQVDTVVLIAGVTGGPTGFAGMNGEQKVVTKPTSTSLTFATTLPDGTYTGTITMKMAPLGWLKPFSGTNKAVYKSSDVTSTGCFLRVDDAGTTTCRVRGYVSMTDVDTGLEPFPTDAQMSGGGYWGKSGVANAVATQWVLYGDGKIFYLFNAPSYSTNATQFGGITRFFGDPIAFKPSGDAYCCALSYSIQSSVTSAVDGALDSSGNVPQIATPRNHTGLGSAVLYGKTPAGNTTASASGLDSTYGVFPGGQVDGALRLVKVDLKTAASNVGPRAEFPGVYHAPHSNVFDTFKTFDTTPGSGSLTGRTVMALTNINTTTSTIPSSSSCGAAFFDKTGPWR
jgi:hypothetical protein